MTYPAQYTDDPDLQALIGELFAAGSVLPDMLRLQLLEASQAVAEALVRLLVDEELAVDDAPGEGWAPIHAAHILAERREVNAIAPMIDILETCEPDEYLYGQLINALGNYGELSLEPLLYAVDAAIEENFRHGLLEALAELGVRDERIYEHLLTLLTVHPLLATMYLASYGDPRAIDPLLAALDSIDSKASTDPLDDDAISEIAFTIEELGGRLSKGRRDKVDRARRRMSFTAQALREQHAPSLDDSYQKSAREKLGRNDPCWCGSGDKYKRCHWAENRES
jgi:hypothetical protein